MKKFQIFRYLNKLKYAIVALTLLGSFAVHFYAQANQTYTATTVIEYTNDDAVNGKTPTGATIDVTDIYSSAVITDVLKDLNLNVTMESIRSKCQVTEIIPQDELDRKAAVLDKGEDYVYHPTKYIVNFTSQSESYARDVLDSIIQNYLIFYSEKYVDELVLPNNSANVLNSGYDFIERAEIIDKSVEEIAEYLRVKKDNYSNFRSSKTGYSFADLNDIYLYIRNYDVPEIFTSILEVCSTQDKDILIKKYKDDISSYNLEITNLTSELNELKKLIEQYTDKSDESMKYHFDFGQGSTENNYILKDVQGDKNGEYEPTAYDQMISRYVSLSNLKQTNIIERDHDKYLLSVFEKSKSTVSQNDRVGEAISENINSLVYELKDYYKIVKDTAIEFNEFQGAENIRSVNTISITSSINIKLYILLAFILSFVVAMIGAIIVGRVGDFIEYLMFTDKKTGLPNRAKCDLIIEKYSQRNLLDNDFSFILIRITSLNSFDRERGDIQLKDFGAILLHLSKGYGFVGYNDSKQFLCFFENCQYSKAEMFVEVLQDRIMLYNRDNPDNQINFEFAISETTTEDIFKIRKLIRRAFAIISGDNEDIEQQTVEKVTKSQIQFKKKKRGKKQSDL